MVYFLSFHSRHSMTHVSAPVSALHGKRGSQAHRLRRGLRALCATLALTGAGSLAGAAQDCQINGQRVDPERDATLAGKSGLMLCMNGGVRVREQQVNNGAFVGAVRLYEQGQLAKSYSLNDKGNIDGPAREFSPGGQVLRESTYDNGVEVGLIRSYFPNGKLRRVAFRSEPGGERAVVEFTQTGQLMALRCGDAPMLAPIVDDARLCGFKGVLVQSELYDEQGTLRSRLVHSAGKRVRTESLYDNGRIATQEETSDKLIIERRFSSEGIKRYELISKLTARAPVRQREQEFSEKGLLLRDQRWNDAGEPISDISYTPTGQVLSRTAYSGTGAVRMVDVIEFHPNGQRAAQGHFLAPVRASLVPIGTHLRFNDQGVLINELTYNATGRITHERAWNDAGELVRNETVQPDGTRVSN